MVEISLRPEYIARVGNLLITNSFFTTILVTLLLSLLALTFAILGQEKNFVIQIWRISIFELLRFIDKVTGDRNISKKILPLVATLFIFIMTANLIALIPGFLGSIYLQRGEKVIPLLRSPNSDLTTTLALALFSVVSIQIFSLQTLGMKKYLLRFFSLQNPILFVVGFFEMVSEGVKVISFSFRLFGNIFAGEVVLLIAAFLLPYFIPLPFLVLELFVGIIQAFIFAMLTLAFIKTSIWVGK